MKYLAIALFMLWANQARAQTSAGLPDDARLQPVRDRIEVVIAAADRAGLPNTLIVNKVREGLAKGVPADVIADVVDKLGTQLQQAQALVRRKGFASERTAMLRALAEAQMAGWSINELGKVLDLRSRVVDRNDLGDEKKKPAALRRAERIVVDAVHTATDLSLRGYAHGDALAIVETAATRDADELDRLPGALERLRREYALNHVDAAVSLQRALSVSPNLDAAVISASANAQGKGLGVGGNANGKAKGNPGKGLGVGAARGKALGVGKGKGMGPKK